jgi:uncharacterized protein YqgV (UPF0045/DUF77 family)
MAIQGINKILEAQQAQRSGNTQSNSTLDSENQEDAMHVLKLIFEYMRNTNSEMIELIQSLKEKQDVMDKKIDSIEKKLGN